MKTLIISLFFSFGLLVTAQASPRSTLHSRIADDGKTLSIQLDGFQSGHQVHYDQTFDVAGMNSLRKDLLKYRAFRSQGLVVPLQETTGLILVPLILLASILTIIVIRFQRKKALLIPVKLLKSE